MMIRLRHPDHGEMDVYSEADALANGASGWVPVEAAEKPPADLSDDSILATDLRTQYIAKFGKPPHHRMLDDTIRALVEQD